MLMQAHPFPGAESDQPFCAGVLISDAVSVLLTLGDTDTWTERGGHARIPIGGVGGGQVPGETIDRCAMREAAEELGCPVRLASSRITIVEDPYGRLSLATSIAPMAPLLHQVQRRVSAAPFAPGLPPGPLLHCALYRAVSLQNPRPADVPALVWIPWTVLLSMGRGGIKLRLLEQAGGRILSTHRMPPEADLYIPSPSLQEMLIRVCNRFGRDAVVGSPVSPGPRESTLASLEELGP